MGFVISIIGFAVIGGFIWYLYYESKPVKGPMYPKYMNVQRPRLTVDEMQNRKNPICALCCRPFNVLDRPSRGKPEDVFCAKCDKKISSYGDDFRPSYITSERDWMYLKRIRGTKFWIINGDYERGDVDAAQAARWMHGLVPESFGTIKPIRYRGPHRYAHGVRSHLDSTSDVSCDVCNNTVGSCQCRKLYSQAVLGGKYPDELKPHLERLRALNPSFVITEYYRRDNKIMAETEPRENFAVEDFFTFDDWQSITYLLNFSRQEEYTEQTVREAVSKYVQMVEKDLRILGDFYEKRQQGLQEPIPLLPSTNPANILTVKTPQQQKTKYDKLTKEFMG